MGLIVKSKGENKVTISGSPIELENGVYVRVEYGVRRDGRTIQGVLHTFYDKQSYKDDKFLNTSITGATFEDALPEGVAADLLPIMELTKSKIEEFGLSVEIVDIN